LDIILVNTDRNEGNILIKKQKDNNVLSLIPIDHGYCLPEILEIAWCDWVWLDWAQAKMPISAELKEHILNFDVEHFAQLLKKVTNIRDECLLNMKITTRLLQKGIAAGLNLYNIAKIIARDNLDAPSLLEIIIAQARALARKSCSSASAVSRGRAKSSVLHRFYSGNHSESSSGVTANLNNEDGGSSSEIVRDSRRMHIRWGSIVSTGDLSMNMNSAFFREFWKFLEDLMDGLIERKARSLKRRFSRILHGNSGSISNPVAAKEYPKSSFTVVAPTLSNVYEPDALEDTLGERSRVKSNVSWTSFESGANSPAARFNASADLEDESGALDEELDLSSSF